MSEILLNPYCTLQEAQDFLEDSTPSHVDRITRAINAASRYADSITSKIFYLKSYTAAPVLPAMAGPGNWIVNPSAVYTQPAYIQAPYAPIIPGSIAFTSGGITLAEGTDYTVDYENGMIMVNAITGQSVAGWMPNVNLITADVGYDNGTTPYDNTMPSPDIPGSIRFNIPRLIPFFSGLWRKAIMTDGSAAFVNMGQGKLPQDILDLWEKIRQGRKP
jgi:hypothetical protein